MADNKDVKPEIFFKYAKDLQQEKVCLEQKLSELRSMKAKAEDTLDAVRSKHGKVKEINRKMAETVKGAQCKVSLQQFQITSIEGVILEKRRNLAAINQEIEDEKKRQLDETRHFESKLSELSAKLKDARDFYTPCNVQKEIDKLVEEGRNFEKQIEESEKQSKELTSRLEQQELDREEATPEIPAADQEMVLNLFQGALRGAEERAEQAAGHKGALQSRLQELIHV